MIDHLMDMGPVARAFICAYWAACFLLGFSWTALNRKPEKE